MSASQPEGMHYTEEDLSDYFAGEMADDEAIELARHLDMCAECRAAADEPSRRALAWAQWPSAAPGHASATPNAALTAAKTVVVPIDQGRGFKHVIMPALSAVASVAAGALLVLNLRENRDIQAGVKRIQELENQAAAYQRHISELQSQVAELRKRGPVPHDNRVPQPPGPQSGGGVLAVLSLPEIDLRAKTAGANDVPSQTRVLQREAKEYRLPLLITGHPVGETIHVVLAEADKLINRDLKVEAQDGKYYLYFDVTAAEIAPFLDRPAKLTASTADNVVGTVMLTLGRR